MTHIDILTLRSCPVLSRFHLVCRRWILAEFPAPARSRHLGEALLEVVVERVRPRGEHRERRVLAKGEQRLLPSVGHVAHLPTHAAWSFSGKVDPKSWA